MAGRATGGGTKMVVSTKDLGWQNSLKPSSSASAVVMWFSIDRTSRCVKGCVQYARSSSDIQGVSAAQSHRMPNGVRVYCGCVMLHSWHRLRPLMKPYAAWKRNLPSTRDC